MSQTSEVQLPASSTLESRRTEGLVTSIYLCRCIVRVNLCVRRSTLTLTMSDIDEVVPKSRRRTNKKMYLFHT